MTSMDTTLISKVHTVEDKIRFESDLAKLSRAVFKQGEFQRLLTTEVAKELSDVIISDVGTGVPGSAYLEGLNRQLETLQAVDITVSYVPTKAQVDQLYSWIGEHVGHHIILSIHTNPKLLAGARVEFAGRYLDASLAAKLN